MNLTRTIRRGLSKQVRVGDVIAVFNVGCYETGA